MIAARVQPPELSERRRGFFLAFILALLNRISLEREEIMWYNHQQISMWESNLQMFKETARTCSQPGKLPLPLKGSSSHSLGLVRVFHVYLGSRSSSRRPPLANQTTAPVRWPSSSSTRLEKRQTIVYSVYTAAESRDKPNDSPRWDTKYIYVSVPARVIQFFV